MTIGSGTRQCLTSNTRDGSYGLLQLAAMLLHIDAGIMLPLGQTFAWQTLCIGRAHSSRYTIRWDESYTAIIEAKADVCWHSRMSHNKDSGHNMHV